jgi:hypothetical protein
MVNCLSWTVLTLESPQIAFYLCYHRVVVASSDPISPVIRLRVLHRSLEQCISSPRQAKFRQV